MRPGCREEVVTLGTDGFGRSENRQYLRAHFEVNAEVDRSAAAASSRLARDGKFDVKKAVKAIAELGVDPEKVEVRRGRKLGWTRRVRRYGFARVPRARDTL